MTSTSVTPPGADAGVRRARKNGRAGSTRRTHRPATPWLFLAPGLLVVAAFSLYPFISTVYKSFTSARTLTPGEWTGVDNYRDMLSDEQFWTGMRNSVIYVVGVVPFTVMLPLLLAMLVKRYVPGITFFRSAFYTPVVASVVVVGLIWVWMLDDRGLINGMLEFVGLPKIEFLADPWLIMASAAALTIWKGLGYYMIVYLAALSNVPKELHEAASVDGAGPVRRFFTVTLPAVRSTMVLVAAISSVAAFKVFSEVYLLAGPNGGPAGKDTTLVMLVQRVGTGLSGRVGYASAISVVIFLITLVLMLIVLRANRKDED
jgi:multiple sugar transport system permease protein